jgi:transcriptional regulator with XRE-family HTH domain
MTRKGSVMAIGKATPRTVTAMDRYIGVRLRERRRAGGMSQTTLAMTIGVTYQQLQKYEVGSNRVAASTLVDIANALGVSAASLLPASEDQAQDFEESGLAEFAPVLISLGDEGRQILLRVARALARDKDLRSSPQV